MKDARSKMHPVGSAHADHTTATLLARVDAWLLDIVATEHSVEMRIAVVKWIAGAPPRFHQLVQLVLHGSRMQAQRASYPLTFAVELWPHLAVPHVLDLLGNLQRADIHPGVVRHTMRLLRFVPLENASEGQIFSAAFAALVGPVEIAVKADAISVLARLVSKFPELRHEVEQTIREGLAGATMAYRSRARSEFQIFSDAEM